jgi:hypothetical protein
MASSQDDDTKPVRFPAYRSYAEARIAINDSLMALVVGAGLAREKLPEDRDATLLASAFPSLPHVQRMNQSIGEVESLLSGADVTVARIAIPYIFSVYGVYLADAIGLLQGVGADEDGHEPDDTHLSVLHERFESATGIMLPERELALFELIRTIRNRLAHQAGTPGSKLGSRWRNMPKAAREEWLRVAGRPITDLLVEASTPMDLGLGELFATLAVTHRLAHRVNAGLAESVADEMWAELVVVDYRELWPQRYRDPARRVKRIHGFARHSYAPLGLSSDQIEEALKRVGGSTN